MTSDMFRCENSLLQVNMYWGWRQWCQKRTSPYLCCSEEFYFVTLLFDIFKLPPLRAYPVMSGALNAEQLTWRLLCVVCRRTNTLLEKVAAAVEQSAFYSALWGSILTSPAVRLPGVSFVLLHLNRKLSMEDQLYVMGNDIELMVFDSMLPNNVNNHVFLFNLKYCRIKRCFTCLTILKLNEDVSGFWTGGGRQHLGPGLERAGTEEHAGSDPLLLPLPHEPGTQKIQSTISLE